MAWKIQNGIFFSVIFGPGMFWGFVGSPGDFLGF